MDEGAGGRRAKLLTLFWLLSIAAAFSLCAPAYSQAPAATGPEGAQGKQGPPPGPPPPRYQLLRENEDWSFLRDPARRTGFWDPIKYIPLGNRENWYLTLGGETRQWWERFDNEDWGRVPNDSSGYLLQRYMFHADFHLGDRFRTFVQLKSGVVSGRAAGPRPVDKDNLDFHQGFLDINFGLTDRGDKPALTIRAGRQELHYGGGRLVSAREGPNVRAGFDGLRAIVNVGGFRIEGFGLKPVQTNPGFFDDSPDHRRTFWGTYGTGKVADVPVLSAGTVDFYYLGFRRKVGIFSQGLGPESRHTVGGRLWNRGRPWDYDVEAAFQFGTFGPGTAFGPTGPRPLGQGNIRAWTVSTETGYTFERVRFRPRLALNTGITSGDKDPLDPNLQTFFTPFPNGHYFGTIQHNGPLNIQGFRPALTLTFPRRMMFTVDSFFFWRQRLADGIYNVPGFPMRPGGLSRARYIGTQPQAGLFWIVNPNMTVMVGYAHFIAGPFLRETPPGRNLRYANAVIGYRF